jgi:hypothetical protein
VAGAKFFRNVDIRPVSPAHALDELGSVRGIIGEALRQLSFPILRVFVVFPLAPGTVVGTVVGALGFTLVMPCRRPGFVLLLFLVAFTA